MCPSPLVASRTLLPKAIVAWLAACFCAVLICHLTQSVDAQESPLPSTKVSDQHATDMKAGTELFKGSVRSLLTERCLRCHGGEKLLGEFDLTSRESLMASGFVDNKAPRASSLLAVIKHESEPFMPKDAPKLSESEIEKIQRWIELGAPYDRPLGNATDSDGRKPAAISEEDRNFWSFRGLQRPTPPEDPTGWSQTEIDRFIAAGHLNHNLKPNSKADRRRLARRAYLDLIGMPPSEEELATFLEDASANAYESMLDRLLESPHYGERWARHWMDIARFAESHGYEQDYDRPVAYHYRDFLIRALNMDMPYDQFVQWQVAGDELAPQNPLALMATGFLGAGAFPTQLTEAEFESARYDELDDMCSTLGTAVLGLSVGCARCHAHKFDPIPSSDYYRFAANFARTIRSEVELDLEPEENLRRKQKFEESVKELEDQIAAYEAKEFESDARVWLSSADLGALQTNPWQLLQAVSVKAKQRSEFREQGEGIWIANGKVPAKEVVTVEGQAANGKVASLRLEALADTALPQKGPGRAGNGNFVLSNLSVFVVDTKGKVLRTSKLISAKATHEQNSESLSVAASIDSDRVSGWAVDGGGIGKDQAAVFELESPLELAGDERLRIEMAFEHSNPSHSLGKFRLSVSDQNALPANVGIPGIAADVVVALQKLKASWDPSSSHFTKARSFLASQLVKYQDLTGRLARLRSEGPRLAMAKVQITSEGFPHMKHHADDRGYPHFYPDVHVLSRGDVAQKRGVAQNGYLQILMRGGKTADQWKTEKPDDWTRTTFRRAGVAKWLTDVEAGAGPLVARVIVNRIWQHHFGRGIVATPSDFGRQGEAPSHPELLEWLASDLVANGWKLKRLHKQIMTSSVYMQSSDFDETKAAVDRENVFLWRFTPRRLEAEAIRDSLLAVSGELDRTMYGPGTLDQGMRRRSIYFFVKRSQLVPMMLLFDWPEHLVGIGARPVTTVAPQALALMNHPAARQWAEGLAKRIHAEKVSGSASAKSSSKSDRKPGTADVGVNFHDDAMRTRSIDRLYSRALGRSPSEAEKRMAEDFLVQQAMAYQNQGSKEPALNALVDLCQTVLSMNELIYVD